MEYSDNQEAKEYVLRMAKEYDVGFIRLWFTDILGSLKGFSITVGELADALDRGKSFDGASIDGFARVDENDMVAFPDPTTFRILPWKPRQDAVARMFCDILTPDGRPFEGDPRQVLKRNLMRAANLGFTYYVGPELEYFYFTDSEHPIPLDVGGYFEQTAPDVASDLRRETVLTLEDLGIPVEYSHHEVAPSQHEVDLRYTDALNMADTLMTYRLVVKVIASRHGAYATFMPKPLTGENGSGMHVHQSLFRGDQNAFFDQDNPEHLSATARRYIAGLLRHAPEITVVTNQWVNSYKRLVPGFEAPTYVSWAHVNRSDLIRVPSYREGREDSMRIEYRSPDPACNPYLAFSVMLAAGLEGIENGYELPPPAAEDVYKLSQDERKRQGIGSLPTSLWEAVQEAEGSSVLQRALGQHVFDSFMKNKKIECEQYRRQVTDYEIKRYLPIL